MQITKKPWWNSHKTPKVGWTNVPASSRPERRPCYNILFSFSLALTANQRCYSATSSKWKFQHETQTPLLQGLNKHATRYVIYVARKCPWTYCFKLHNSAGLFHHWISLVMFHKICQVIKFLSTTHIVLAFSVVTYHHMSDLVLQSKVTSHLMTFQEGDIGVCGFGDPPMSPSSSIHTVMLNTTFITLQEMTRITFGMPFRFFSNKN